MIHAGTLSLDLGSNDQPTTISTKTNNNYKEPATTKTSYWQIGFLKGLNWGMDGEEVTKTMARNGYLLKVVSNYETGTGFITHQATVSGQLLYGNTRIDEIQFSFANRKLMSVSFVSANSTDAEALYTQTEKMFGMGLTTISHATEEQKKHIEHPLLCKNSERYFTPTAIESRLGYTWSQRNNQFVRYCSINIYDWIKSDRVYERDHSFKADRFQKLLKETDQSITQIQMERRSGQIEIVSKEADQPITQFKKMTLTLGTNCGFVTSRPSGDPDAGDSTTIDYRSTCMQDTSPATAVKVTEIGWYANEATQAVNFDVAIYTDSSNYPTTIVGNKSTGIKGTSSGWKHVTVDIEISASTTYWIAMQCDNTSTTTTINNDSSGLTRMCVDTYESYLRDPFANSKWVGPGYGCAIYAIWEARATETNQQP